MGNNNSRDLAIVAIPLSIAAILIYKDQQSQKNINNKTSTTKISRREREGNSLVRSSRRFGDEITPCSSCGDEEEDENNISSSNKELDQTSSSKFVDEQAEREIEELKRLKAEMAKDASRVRRSMKQRYGDEKKKKKQTEASQDEEQQKKEAENDAHYGSPFTTRFRSHTHNQYKTIGISSSELNNSPSFYHNSKISRHEDVIGDVIDQDILFHRNNNQQQQEQQQQNGEENQNQYENFYVSASSPQRSSYESQQRRRYVGAMTVSSSVNSSASPSPFTSVSRSRNRNPQQPQQQQQQQQDFSIVTVVSDDSNNNNINNNDNQKIISSSAQRALKRNHLAGSEIPGMQSSALRGEASRPIREFLLLDPLIRKEIKREASIRTYKEQQQRRDEMLMQLENTGGGGGFLLEGTQTFNSTGGGLVVDEDGNEIQQQQTRGNIRYTSMRHQRTQQHQREQEMNGNNNNNNEDDDALFGEHVAIEDREYDDEEIDVETVHQGTKVENKKPPRFHHVAQSEEQANAERFQQVVELLYQEHDDGAAVVSRFEAHDRLNIVRQHENWMMKNKQK